MSSTRLQRRFRRTVRITLSWMAVGIAVAVFQWNTRNTVAWPATFPRMVAVELWRAFVAGILGGGVYIFLLRDRLRVLPFVRAFAIMATLVLLVVIGTHAAVPAAIGGNGPFLTELGDRLFTLAFLGEYLFWALLMGATMLMVRYNDQYGSGGVGYLMGRYHKPREELRIFMFLDMRSSTAIAEELGHVKYFQLLNEVYADITDPVLDSGGEIYQYVGDEVSVTWPFRKGIKHQRCIRCFFAIRKRIANKAEQYKARYGLVPTFKAGFHYGPVTVGEVGQVKKEVIFSGDPVITAARIQSRCNEIGVDNLVSGELLDVLRMPESAFRTRAIGEIPLRGRKRTVSLWTVSSTDEPAPPEVKPATATEEPSEAASHEEAGQYS